MILTITDKDGAQATDTATVQVSEDNHPPTAILSGPTSGLVGETLSFDGSGSSDSDGSIVSYAWDLGDGTTSGGVDVAHSYSAAGSYQVTLTVTDDGGLSDSATQTVQVEEPNLPPTATLSGPTSGLVGETLGFHGSGSSGAAGSYQVTLTVTDDSGLSDSATQTVQVEEPNLPPTAVIGGPMSGLEGETLSFNGSGSSDSDGRIVSYAWDLGDGSTGSGVDVNHSYSAAGSYQVTLTVTDDGGLDDSATQAVQVEEPNLPPTAVISGPTGGLVGETLSFSGAGSTDDDGLIVSYAWDFSDGTTSSGITVTHSYSATGSYQVTLSVTDDSGLSDGTMQTVQVGEVAQINPPPSTE
jgi:PKD repeat protein